MTKLVLAPGQSPADLLKQVTKRRNKFNAVRTGSYASKAEARYAEKLRAMKQAGVIEGWLEQVPIKLADGVTYRVDFMVIERDGSVRFVEVKGHETEGWKIKSALIKAQRPEIFSRLDVIR